MSMFGESLTNIMARLSALFDDLALEVERSVENAGNGMNPPGAGHWSPRVDRIEALWSLSEACSADLGIPLVRAGDLRPDESAFIRRVGKSRREIVLNDEMSDGEQAIALVHEVAHAILHRIQGVSPTEYSTHEVEAESVAYLAAAAVGLVAVGSVSYIAFHAALSESPRHRKLRILDAVEQILQASLR